MSRSQEQDTRKGAKPKTHDPARALADELRGRHGIESRAGVEADERVEYFRGKDFAAWFKKHPDRVLAGVAASGATLDDGIREMMQLLMRRGLVKRTDRFYKKPKPGKKRLTKWPRKLTPLPLHEQKWLEDAFYCWTYDLPTSPWMLFGSIGLAALVVLLCLFPLAPYKLKISVVYLSLGLIGALFGLILLRWVIAGATWVAAGRVVWLLPNLLSETVGLDEAFKPVWEVEEVGDDWAWWKTYAWQRVLFGVTCGALLWGLHQVGPGTGELTSGAKATHDQILEWLNLQDAQFQKLTDASNETAVAEPVPPEQPADSGEPGPPRRPSAEERTASSIAAAAARAAAAQAARGEAPTPEDIPAFEQLLEEEVLEAEAEAEAAARAAGGTDSDVAAAREAAAVAVRARVIAREVPPVPPVPDKPTTPDAIESEERAEL